MNQNNYKLDDYIHEMPKNKRMMYREKDENAHEKEYILQKKQKQELDNTRIQISQLKPTSNHASLQLSDNSINHLSKLTRNSESHPKIVSLVDHNKLSKPTKHEHTNSKIEAK